MCDDCIFRDPNTGICNITNTLATYPLECAAYSNRKEEYREIMRQFKFFDEHHPGFGHGFYEDEPWVTMKHFED